MPTDSIEQDVVNLIAHNPRLATPCSAPPRAVLMPFMRSSIDRYIAFELNDVVLATPLVTTYGYDAADNLVSTRRPNGTAEARRYDELNRLVAVEDMGPAGTPISRFTYTLDPAGHRTAVDELGGRRVEYTYDNLYRLTRETIHEPGSDPRTIEYTYDRVGNRLSRRDSAGDFGAGFTSSTYDARDRLIDEESSGSRVTYSYDANGNTESRTDGVADAVYTWDEEDRLVAAVLTDRAAGTARHLGYRYNAEGIRVAAIDDGRETRSLIDGEQAFDQVLEEYAPGGALAAAYVRGLDLIFQDREGARSFYHKDGLGSTRALTDAAGAVTDTYDYDAYGGTIGQAGETANDFLFAGEQRDAPLGWDYLRARYYDTAAGRFASRDSFEGFQGVPISLHRYLYANADPVDFTDPSGMTFASSALTISITVALVGIGITTALYFLPVNNEQLPTVNPNKRLGQLEQLIANKSTYPTRASYLARLRQPQNLLVIPAGSSYRIDQVGGGSHRSETRAGLPNGSLVGPYGCGPCLGVVLVTPSKIVAVHFYPGGDHIGRTLDSLGPYPAGTHAVLAGGENSQYTYYALYETVEYLENNGIEIDGFYDGPSIFADNQGRYYVYRPNRSIP